MDREGLAYQAARRLMWRSITLAAIFAVVFSSIVGYQFSKISNLANDNKKITHQSCLNSNKVRSEVIEVWEFIFNLNPSPTEKQHDDITAARNKIASVYKQQLCP